MKNLTKANLAIAALAPKEDDHIRKLNGLHVTPDFTEVTDGHILVRVAKPAQTKTETTIHSGFSPSQDKAGVLSRAGALALAKSLPRKSLVPGVEPSAAHVLSSDGLSYVASFSDNSVTAMPLSLSADYVNADSVVKDVEPSFAISFNAVKLAKLFGALAGIISETGQVVLRFTDHKSAMRISGKTKSGQDITALIMPMRDSVVDDINRLAEIRRREKAQE